MTEASLCKILNSGTKKFTEEELSTIINILKRLAEIEYSNNIIRKNQNQNEK